MKAASGPACLPNIGPRERRRRMVLAVVAAAIAVATAVFMLASGTPRPWRLIVFLPAWAAVLCYLEARRHTCVVLAARGLRNLDLGDERVDDAAARRASNAQSRAIYLSTTVFTGIAITAFLLVP